MNIIDLLREWQGHPFDKSENRQFNIICDAGVYWVKLIYRDPDNEWKEQVITGSPGEDLARTTYSAFQKFFNARPKGVM